MKHKRHRQIKLATFSYVPHGTYIAPISTKRIGNSIFSCIFLVKWFLILSFNKRSQLRMEFLVFYQIVILYFVYHV